MALGWIVGGVTAVGVKVGVKVGSREGNSVGVRVGASGRVELGVLAGSGLGAPVPLCNGLKVGVSVGVTLGLNFGDSRAGHACMEQGALVLTQLLQCCLATDVCWPLLDAMHVAVAVVTPLPHVTEHWALLTTTHSYTTGRARVGSALGLAVGLSLGSLVWPVGCDHTMVRSLGGLAVGLSLG